LAIWAWAKSEATAAGLAPTRLFSCWLRLSWAFDEKIANDLVAHALAGGLFRFGMRRFRLLRFVVVLAIFSFGRHTHRLPSN
jgi:hypothetical protein